MNNNEYLAMTDDDYIKYEKWLADLLKRTGNDGPVPEGKFRGVPSPHAQKKHTTKVCLKIVKKVWG